MLQKCAPVFVVEVITCIKCFLSPLTLCNNFCCRGFLVKVRLRKRSCLKQEAWPNMKEIYLTRAGYQKFIGELEALKTLERRKLSKAIGEARAHGDIGENAEYDAAKEAQAQNEQRIAELEEKLSRARIIDDEDIAKDRVLIGATVKLKDLDSNEEIEYTLVSEEEADFAEGKISITSPVGSSLLNHKENDIVEVKVPAGILKYKILKISR